MMFLKRTLRQGIWVSGLVAAALTGAGAHAQVANVDAEVTTGGSGNYPHPTTYTWRGNTDPIKEPGPFFYSFYYVGTVNPDARVGEEVTVQRIAVPNNEWAANRKRIIAQLTLFYQLSRNLEPTARRELNGEPSTLENLGNQVGNQFNQFNQAFPGANTAMPGAFNPGFPGGSAAPGGMTPDSFDAYGNPIPGGAPQTPGFNAPGYEAGFNAAPGFNDPNNPAGYNMPMPGMPGMDPGNPDQGFTPFGGAMEPGLNNAPPMLPQMPMAPGGGMPGMPGMMPGMPGGGFGGFGGFGGGDRTFDARAAAEWTFYYDQYVLWQYYCARVLLNGMEKELLEGEAVADPATEADGQTGTSLTSGGPGGDPGLGGDPTMGGGGMDGFINSQTGNFYAQRSGAMPGGMNDQDMDIRQRFNPVLDFRDPERRLADHGRFLEAAQEIEDEIGGAFLEMISRIEKRELDQENYEKWLVAKRDEASAFANSWSQMKEGNALVMQDNLYLITEEPLDVVPINGVNVVRGAQLTPQDLINSDGTLKQPQVD